MNYSVLIDYLFNATGLLGVGLIILAYLLVQIEKLASHDMRYLLLNLIGALLHIVSLLRFWNLASFIIELFWVGISLYGLFRSRRFTSPSP